ncbi:MAG: hypothetical protein U0271_35780 [Polyangiaceae bacterium]
MEDAPVSLETRMLVESLKSQSTYPMLRAARWLIFVAAGLYGLSGCFAAVSLLSETITRDERAFIQLAGGPSDGAGLAVAAWVVFTTAVRVTLALAAAEGIKLALDLRTTQLAKDGE